MTWRNLFDSMTNMKKLTKYINSLSEPERKKFARRCGTTINYLRKAVSSRQELGAQISVCIERETGGMIDRRYLHPKKYWLIWPELPRRKRVADPDKFPPPLEEYKNV